MKKTVAVEMNQIVATPSRVKITATIDLRTVRAKLSNDHEDRPDGDERDDQQPVGGL